MMMLFDFFRKSHMILFLLLFGMVLTLSLSLYAVYLQEEEYITDKFREKIVKLETLNLVDGMKEKGILTMPFSEEAEEWLANRTGGTGYSFEYRDLHGNVWRNRPKAEGNKTIETPIIAEGELLGTVSTSYSNKDIHDIPPPDRRLFSDGIIFIILFFTLASYFLSKKLSYGLRELSKQAGRISQGYRKPDLQGNGPKELQQIALVLNALIREVNQQERMRQTLMQDVSHELRTPLTSMITTIEAMMDGIYPTTEEQLREIYEEMERLGRLVNDMELLSDAESSHFSLKINKQDMAKLLKGVYQSFVPIAEEHGMKFIYEKPHTPCYAEVDQDRVIQMVFNLLSNAMKYSPFGSTVTLGLVNDEDHVIIYCKDSGIGIDDQHIDLIFNRLYRVDQSRSRKSGGLGVGLSITKALVEAHRGEIKVESALNKGSTFTVILPKSYMKDHGGNCT